MKGKVREFLEKLSEGSWDTFNIKTSDYLFGDFRRWESYWRSPSGVLCVRILVIFLNLISYNSLKYPLE